LSQSIASSISNVLELSSETKTSWVNIVAEKPSISGALLKSVDTYGQILAKTLSRGSSETIIKENISM